MTRDPRARLQLQRAEDGARLRRRRAAATPSSRRRRADLAASFQAAVVGQLAAKLERALAAGDWRAVALGGGVAANALLRERVAEICERRGVGLKLVARELCTDNAAMIGSAARYLDPAPYPDYLSWDASSE